MSGIGLAASGSRLLGHAVTAQQIFETAAADPEFDAMVSAFIDGLALHLVNLVIAIDPARVAVGGGMVKILGPPPGTAGAGARVKGPFPPELVIAAYPFDAPLVGALALAIEAAGARLPCGIRLPAHKPEQESGIGGTC